jgi:hypothetical protein
MVEMGLSLSDAKNLSPKADLLVVTGVVVVVSSLKLMNNSIPYRTFGTIEYIKLDVVAMEKVVYDMVKRGMTLSFVSLLEL